MLRRSLFILLFLFVPIITTAADLSQRQWMTMLVDAMGWGFGLPEEPQDEDYLHILEGTRVFHLEVEDLIGDRQPVSVKAFTHYGPFEGEGWVSGISRETEATIPFLVPEEGRYRMLVRIRKAPFVFNLGELRVTAEAGDLFETVDLGELHLPAGPMEILIGFPAQGGIDSIDLIGVNRQPVAPRNGWKLDRPLSREDLSLTLLQVLGLVGTLPPKLETQVIELETDARFEEVSAVSLSYLGRPSGGRWVRAANRAGSLATRLDGGEGYVAVSFRGLGEEIEIVFDERYHFVADAKSYLSDVPLGVIPLKQDGVEVRVELPPRTGADALTLTALSVVEADLTRAAGLHPGDRVTAELAQRLLGMAAQFGPAH